MPLPEIDSNNYALRCVLFSIRQVALELMEEELNGLLSEKNPELHAILQQKNIEIENLGDALAMMEQKCADLELKYQILDETVEQSQKATTNLKVSWLRRGHECRSRGTRVHFGRLVLIGLSFTKVRDTGLRSSAHLGKTKVSKPLEDTFHDILTCVIWLTTLSLSRSPPLPLSHALSVSLSLPLSLPLSLCLSLCLSLSLPPSLSSHCHSHQTLHHEKV